MGESREPPSELLLRLQRNTALRREQLLVDGLKMQRRKRLLGVCTLILTMIAGILGAAVTAKSAPASVLELGSLGVSAFLGLFSAIAALNYRDEDISGRLRGAAEYLSLRERVAMHLATMGSPTSRATHLKLFVADYSKLDESYSRYFQDRIGNSFLSRADSAAGGLLPGPGGETATSKLLGAVTRLGRTSVGVEIMSKYVDTRFASDKELGSGQKKGDSAGT